MRVTGVLELPMCNHLQTSREIICPCTPIQALGRVEASNQIGNLIWNSLYRTPTYVVSHLGIKTTALKLPRIFFKVPGGCIAQMGPPDTANSQPRPL